MFIFWGGLIALLYFRNYKGESTFRPMTAVAIKVGRGSIRYRIHAKGKGWYPWVIGYDKNDSIMAMPETGRTSLMEYR